MKKLTIFLVLLASSAFAASGSFTGQVVNGPNMEAGKKWVYVQAAKGATRKVEISTAKVSFDTSVAKANRPAKPEDAVREGAEIRVTASQDGQGEWKASAVEILNAAEH